MMDIHFTVQGKTHHKPGSCVICITDCWWTAEWRMCLRQQEKKGAGSSDLSNKTGLTTP